MDPELLRTWCGPAATAPIQPLAWELPYATGAALKRQIIIIIIIKERYNEINVVFMPAITTPIPRPMSRE